MENTEIKLEELQFIEKMTVKQLKVVSRLSKEGLDEMTLICSLFAHMLLNSPFKSEKDAEDYLDTLDMEQFGFIANKIASIVSPKEKEDSKKK